MKKVYWTTKTGDKIDVDYMSKEHLRNTLKMIIRNNEMLNTIEESGYYENKLEEIKREYNDWLWKD